jgi:hypothetical protein
MTRQLTSPDGLAYYQASDTPDGAAQQQDLANTVQTALLGRATDAELSSVAATAALQNVSVLSQTLTGTAVTGTKTLTGNPMAVTKAGIYLVTAEQGFFASGAAVYLDLFVENPSAVNVAGARQYIVGASTTTVQLAKVIVISATGNYGLYARLTTAGTVTCDPTGQNPQTWSMTFLGT